MLRSFVCPDIEEDEDCEEYDDEIQNCIGNTQQEQTTDNVSTMEGNKTKIFLETAEEKLRSLKSLQVTSYQNKVKNKTRNNIAYSGGRKRVLDIGERRPTESQKSRPNTAWKPAEPAHRDTKRDTGNEDKAARMSIGEMVTKFSKRQDVQHTNKIVLEHLTEQDFKVQEVYDPHGAKKSRIERDLDEAIEQHDFELAQKISDEIAERQLSEKVANNFNACTHLEKKRTEKEAMDKRKKKLTWMFDHKERWESKGNM